MEHFETRPARPDDADAVEEIHARCFVDTFADAHGSGEIEQPDRDGTRRRLRDWFQPDSGLVTRIVEAEGMPIAYFTIHEHRLVHLFVDPDHQRSGIGSRLLADAEEMAAAEGHTELELHTRVDNVRAIAFYERAGWVVTGRTIHTVDDGVGYDEHVLVKADPTLHTRTWGGGDQTVLLLHGQFGSSEMWWEVGPRIAALGYRVVAIDLPGHGFSPRAPEASLDSCVRQVLAACPSADVAVGHSLGALVLGHCAHLLAAKQAIYVDSPFTYEMSVDRDEYRNRIGEAKAMRTAEWLAEFRPWWSDEDRRVEATAAEQFDVDTSVSLMTSMSGIDHRPRSGVSSMIVAARPSQYLSAGDLDRRRQEGFAVREIDGAGHTVWYGRVDEFMSAIASML